MHYLVIATESDETESWSVQRTFISDTELTKAQLVNMFKKEHYKQEAEFGASEPTDNWTEEDFQTFYWESDCTIHVDHVFQSTTSLHLEEVAK